MHQKHRLVVCLLLLLFTISIPAQVLPPVTGEFGETILGLGRIQDIDLSRDGKFLATGSAAGTFLWDTATGQLLHRFPYSVPDNSFEHRIGSLAFSPDGRSLLIVTDSDAGPVLVDVETRQTKFTFAPKGSHASTIYTRHPSVTFSPDEAAVLIGPFLFNARTGEFVKELAVLRDSEVTRFTPDGSAVLTAKTNSGVVQAYDPATGTLLYQLDGHENPVMGIEFSPDGKSVLTFDEYGGGKISNLGTRAVERSFDFLAKEPKSSFVHAAAFSPDGRTIAVGYEDRSAVIWDVQTGTPTVVFNRNAAANAKTVVFRSVVNAADPDEGGGRRVEPLCHDARRMFFLRFLPDGKTLLTGSEDQPIVWDVATQTRVRTFEGHTLSVNFVAVSPDGTRAAGVGLDDEWVRVWDLQTGTLTLAFPAKNVTFGPIQFSPDGKALLLAGGDAARLYSAETGAVLAVYNDVYQAGFSPDGKWVAGVGGFENTVKLFDTATGALIRTMQDPPKEASSLAQVRFTPNGKRIVLHSTFTSPSFLIVWDAETGARLQAITENVGDGVVFSPDGRYAVTSNNGSGKAYLHDLQTMQLLKTFLIPNLILQYSALSANAKYLLLRSFQLEVWDLETEKVALSLTDQSVDVYSSAFSPDTKRLVTGGTDGLLRVWYLPDGLQPAFVAEWNVY